MAQIGRYFAQFMHIGEKMRGSGRDESNKSFGIRKNWWGCEFHFHHHCHVAGRFMGSLCERTGRL